MDWKAPKSVRQIGDTKGKTKIYVEDYVMSFARRMSKESIHTVIIGVGMYGTYENATKEYGKTAQNTDKFPMHQALLCCLHILYHLLSPVSLHSQTSSVPGGIKTP